MPIIPPTPGMDEETRRKLQEEMDKLYPRDASGPGPEYKVPPEVEHHHHTGPVIINEPVKKEETEWDSWAHKFFKAQKERKTHEGTTATGWISLGNLAHEPVYIIHSSDMEAHDRSYSELVISAVDDMSKYNFGIFLYNKNDKVGFLAARKSMDHASFTTEQACYKHRNVNGGKLSILIVVKANTSRGGYDIAFVDPTGAREPLVHFFQQNVFDAKWIKFWGRSNSHSGEVFSYTAGNKWL